MTDLDVQGAAKADNMVNPAFLAASMIEERAPDIVEALNDMPPELAVAVLLHLPPDRAVEVFDQPGLEREPELVTLMPREAAAKLLARVSADRLADIFRQVKEPHCSELLDLLDPDTRTARPSGRTTSPARRSANPTSSSTRQRKRGISTRTSMQTERDSTAPTVTL
jgi:Mg/Co/Ni transporter MgtE